MYPEHSSGGVGEERANFKDLLTAGDYGSSTLEKGGEGTQATFDVRFNIQLGEYGEEEERGGEGGGEGGERLKEGVGEVRVWGWGRGERM